jgi:hypothetical protein
MAFGGNPLATGGVLEISFCSIVSRHLKRILPPFVLFIFFIRARFKFLAYFVGTLACQKRNQDRPIGGIAHGNTQQCAC